MCFCSAVQKPEKLSSVCVAGALRDGLCAYTALHTHARMAAGHTLLVMDGASVCKNTLYLQPSRLSLAVRVCNDLLSSCDAVFRAYVHPVGLLSWSQGSDDVTLAAKAHVPGAASSQRRCVHATSIFSAAHF